MDPDTRKKKSFSACFCDHCLARGVCKIETPFCTQCGSPFSQGFNENHVCEACLKKPLRLGCVRGVVQYSGIVTDAVALFKYHSKLPLAAVFEDLLFQAFVCHYGEVHIDLIMPVPLHGSRLRKRGFNQAFLLVRNFVKIHEQRFGKQPLWKIDTDSLVRKKNTPSQTGFDVEQRRKNLNHAFRVVRPEAVAGKHILLIDDVLTTGATCNEAAKNLLKKGAQQVDALVLART